MIPYFKELGINCVELLPVFEFDEMDKTDVPQSYGTGRKIIRQAGLL